MAKTAKAKKEVTMEEALWKSADKLRGSVEPAEYKHVVLSLFFLNLPVTNLKRRERSSSKNMARSLLILLLSTQKIMYFSCRKLVVGLTSWKTPSSPILH